MIDAGELDAKVQGLTSFRRRGGASFCRRNL